MEHHYPRPRAVENNLTLLRSVESTPPGDLEWALHCTRQQAVLLLLQLPNDQPLTNLEQLAEVFEINVWADGLDRDSTLMLAEGQPPTILVSDRLSNEDQLRAAVRELKRLIDLPARLRMGNDAFSADDYVQVAKAFEHMVLGPRPTGEASKTVTNNPSKGGTDDSHEE